MTISARVQQQFFSAPSAAPEALIRLPPTVVTNYAANAGQPSRVRRASRPRRRTNLWTIDEHERFLRGLAQFPQGPWKEIAAVVATKTTRQTMTHAQKYRQKIERRQRAHSSPTPCVEENDGTDGETRSERDAVSETDVLSDHATVEPIDCAVREATAAIALDADFFDPAIFDGDLTSLLLDLEPIASGLAPHAWSLSCVV